ncbi:hypothetical protein [Bradyrhizobium sp. 179]|nr:hypothetical protein [Bradyrhizobium sp. 179]
MIIAVLANNILPALGTIYLCTIVFKAAKGRKQYPIHRWFF